VIKSLKLTNFLSFGPSSETVELGKLNVLIGANGSGKSNFMAAFDILKSAPSQIVRPFRDAGGAQEWIWKSEGGTSEATVSVTLETSGINMVVSPPLLLCYELTFLTSGLDIPQFMIANERVQDIGSLGPVTAYNYQEESEIERQRIKTGASILSQRRGPQYLEITLLADFFSTIELYREWVFGPHVSYRYFQSADLSTARLEPNAVNLAHVLHRLWQDPDVKQHFRDALYAIYDGIDDFGVDLAGGAVQIFFREGRSKIPATHLSDGTLHYLALLAILCDPNPPPLVCIEEPELGLHPDVFTTLPGLFREASERCQIIVTTHSVDFVDAMTETPEAILVCERDQEGTTIRRPDHLDIWLDEYRLGDLWTSGEIGGNRW
jgi:predicted ATPase